jgi:hypothetical protein
MCIRDVVEWTFDMVYIGRGDPRRGLPASKWANPRRLSESASRSECIQAFEKHARSDSSLLGHIAELKGKTLVCHCERHEACHGDALINLFGEIFDQYWKRAVDAQLAVGMNFFHLFSGPSGRPDGFSAYVRQLGGQCADFDRCNGSEQDVVDDQQWSEYISDLQTKTQAGKNQGLLSGAPCDTFTGARQSRPGELPGPRPLRGPNGRDLYGLPGLTPAEQERVRFGTVCAVRGAQACAVCVDADVDILTENPLFMEGGTSIFKLDEYAILETKLGIHRADFVQCEFGARTSKPSTAQTSLNFDKAPTTCGHAPRWWRLPSTGQWHRGPHPPLRGREWCADAEDWRVRMKRRLPPHGPYITSEAAAYPPLFNRWLVLQFVIAAKARSERRAALQPPMRVVGRWRNVLISGTCGDGATAAEVRDGATAAEVRSSGDTTSRPTAPEWIWSLPLRGAEAHRNVRTEANLMAIGGMRHPRTSINKVPGHKHVGPCIARCLMKFLDDHPAFETACITAFGAKAGTPDPETREVVQARAIVSQILGVPPDEPDAPGKGHCHKQAAQEVKTSLRQPLWTAWAERAGDPDVPATRWLDRGSPAGIEAHPERTGIFPLVPPAEADVQHERDLTQFYEGFLNYTSVEGDPAAQAEIDRLIETGFVKTFALFDDVVKFVEGQPVISKLALITKIHATIAKRRLLLDCKVSGANSHTTQWERIILPLVSDVIQDSLDLASRCEGAEDISYFVLDFKDAFWMLPLLKCEQKYFVAFHNGTFIVWLRVAQGSRNGPQLWGRIAALLGRFSQSLFPQDRMRLQIYTDDPIGTLRGLPAQRRRMCAVLVVAWLVLGLNLAFAKGQLGPEVTWTGHLIAYRMQTHIFVTIKDEFMTDFRATTDAIQKQNVISIKDLRSYAGRANHIANLIWAWRPFLETLWAAIYQDVVGSQAPRGCVWVRQIQDALTWIQAFLQQETGTLCRNYNIVNYTLPHTSIVFTFDASPWGLGGFLLIDGVPKAWFAAPLSHWDVHVLRHDIGDHRGQQTWEDLAALCGLRVWLPHWGQHRAALAVQGDNVGALTLVQKLKATGVGPRIIARELALIYANTAFEPTTVVHTPGVCNNIADALSRRFEPGKKFILPAFLTGVPETVLPTRDYSFWLTLRRAR